MRRFLPSLLIVGLVATLLSLADPADATISDIDPGTLGMRPSGGFLNAARLEQYERDLGRQINWYVAMAGRRSPADMKGSVWGQLRNKNAVLPKIAGRMNLVMTVPLAFGSGSARTESGRAAIRENLLQTASGRWDDAYRTIAKSLADSGYPDAVIRLGHEFTGGWYPWSAQGNDEEYVAAFRHVHDVLQSVSAQFTFEWNAARNTFSEHGPRAYPGDGYVDIVGLDVYYEPFKGDPAQFSDDVWQRRYRSALEAHRDFAMAHGKSVSYAEWANGDVDEPEFIQRMHDWFASLPKTAPGRLLYHSYFNPGKDRYNLDNYPESKARYIQLFGTTKGTALPLPTGSTTPVPTVQPDVTTERIERPIPINSGNQLGPDTAVPSQAVLTLADSYAATVGEPFTLDATIDGESIRWWKRRGPASIRWLERNVEDAELIFREPGTYLLGVRAGRDGAVYRARVTVTVAERPPRVDVGSPSDASPGLSVPLPVQNPSVAVLGAQASEGMNLVYRLVLSHSADHDVIIRVKTQAVTATSDSDFTPVDRYVTIPAGERRAYVGVAAVSDARREPLEVVRLRIHSVRGADIAVRGALGRISD